MSTSKEPTTDDLALFNAIGASEWWKRLTPREAVMIQFVSRMMMPFGEFHRLVEEVLGRPVWTHEFGLGHDQLIAELLGKASPLTPSESIQQLSDTGKPVIVVGAGSEGPTP